MIWLYSTWNGMGWLGFGESNVIHVKTNNFCYDLDELDKTLKIEKESGNDILAVVASLGDPYSMKIENIKRVREICDKYKVWLHGDGANCGILIFSKRYRDYIKDVDLCDSLTLDPHKLLGLNYPTSIFLCKDIEKFNSVVSHWNIVNRKGSFDLGIITPFLNSRGFDSLKLWVLIRYFGLDGVAEIIDRKIDTTKEIYKSLSSLGDRIKFWNSPITFSMLFQIVPDSLKSGINNVDDEFLNKLDEAQNKFKDFFEKETSIGVHSFELPTSIIYRGNLEKKFIRVFCIHNAHEKISSDIINKLKSSIVNFCKNN